MNDDAGAGTGPKRPAHSTRRLTRSSRIAAAVGAAAALAAIGLGSAALIRSPGPGGPGEPGMRPITATSPMPLSGGDILALLDHRPDLGSLDDPRRRASCLSGLGYPGTTPILGGRRIGVDGKPGVLLVLPGEQPDTLVALVVAPSCNSGDTGLLADSIVRRP